MGGHSLLVIDEKAVLVSHLINRWLSSSGIPQIPDERPCRVRAEPHSLLASGEPVTTASRIPVLAGLTTRSDAIISHNTTPFLVKYQFATTSRASNHSSSLIGTSGPSG